jgi:uncharacterized membrane protein
VPLVRLLPWVLWSALVVFSIATYGELPAEIPRKISGAGTITATEPRSWFTWMLLPLVAAGTQVMLSWIGSLLPTQPELFNFTEKERFLKIPADYRGPVVERMRDVMDLVGALAMLLLFTVQVGLWLAATGRKTPWMPPLLMVGSIAFIPIIVLLLLRVNRAVDEAERRWKAAGR